MYKCESSSSRFQPGGGPSRGLLLDYEPSDGPSIQALLTTVRHPTLNLWWTVHGVKTVVESSSVVSAVFAVYRVAGAMMGWMVA